MNVKSVKSRLPTHPNPPLALPRKVFHERLIDQASGNDRFSGYYPVPGKWTLIGLVAGSSTPDRGGIDHED